MPLQKLQFRPGLNREGTDYSNEGGWYDGDKIRFRSGFPEKIGGWTQLSPSQFIGYARSLWVWLDGDSGVGTTYIGVGTSAKYYIFTGGVYYDITPIAQTDTLTNPFATTSGSKTVTVTDVAYSPGVGDYVIFSGASAVGGLTISGEYQVVTVPNATTYTITAASNASSTATGGGTVTAKYEYPAGLNTYSAGTGWGASPFGGVTTPVLTTLGASPFATTSGSSVVTVTQTAHGLATGAYVSISGAAAVAGIAADILNGSHQITNTGTNTYTINVSTIQAGLTANATTTGGGSSVVVLSQSGSQGWGLAYISNTEQQLRLWSNDNYGADLVIAPRGGPIFYWADSSGVNTRAKYLRDVADTTTALTLDSATGAITFTNGVTTITVSGGVAASIYPYMYITGIGIPDGTFVDPTYITGSTSVKISNTTTAGSSGSYNFSYAGPFVPQRTFQVITSAIQEFVIAFGANSYDPHNAGTSFNPMLVRWSDQANAYQWIPQTTNQSGEYLLTNGSFIMCARATRQEILVWTDSAIYSMQYLGAPYVWGFQILMDNISIMSPNCAITVNNVTYWMGRGKFYMYSGRVETLPCSLRQYIFDDINQDQTYQIFAGANEGYNEVWWFYVGKESLDNTVNKYIIYNYLDRVWYYGSFQTQQVNAGSFITGKQYVIATVGTTDFRAVGAPDNNVGTYFIATGAGTGTGTAWGLNGRTAWFQTGSLQYPIAADYNSRILNHENGVDDGANTTLQAIDAYVQSSDFDIGDGHNFGFVWRILPDVNFNGSNVNQPVVTMTVKPRENSGTPYGQADNPQVQSAQNYSKLPAFTVQEFTGQVYTRLRGRQMSFRIESATIGVNWQLGSPRIDIRPDGRR